MKAHTLRTNGGLDVPHASLFGDRHRLATLLLGGLVAVKLAFVFYFAWHTRYVMDEFGQLGFAKYLGHGLFDTVPPTKAVGFAIFYKLAHLIGSDAVSILRVGRLQAALLACAVLALVYRCARAIGETRVRALAILLVLLSFSNFAERIFRTISEPLAVFFAAAALLVIVRRGSIGAGRVLLAGLLCGLSFLTTQKAVYFDVSLGLALVADAVFARRNSAGIVRGLWLVAGWLLAVAGYCFAFGGAHPFPVAQSLVFGPMEVATEGSSDWGNGLRIYVLQTLVRNSLPYALCFAGIGISLAGIRPLDERRRIALVFSVAITIFVFQHYQPWPYVFIMALPFMALWALVPLDRFVRVPRDRALAVAVLSVVVAIGFARNVQYLQFGNEQQLEVVARAEALTGPNDIYFDGIGMLPNRYEPSTLWLDGHYVHKTLREGERSEAYQIFTRSPPKLVIWSYRLDGVEPVVGALIRARYVRIAPNVWLAGQRLAPGQAVSFIAPTGGRYRLYDKSGTPLTAPVDIDGRIASGPFYLAPGGHRVALHQGLHDDLLLPEGPYSGKLSDDADHSDLFADVYN